MTGTTGKSVSETSSQECALHKAKVYLKLLKLLGHLTQRVVIVLLQVQQSFGVGSYAGTVDRKIAWSRKNIGQPKRKVRIGACQKEVTYEYDKVWGCRTVPSP